MESEFIQCDFCKKETLVDSCELATHHTVIEGKEYTFCCKACAKRYQQRKKE
jgi:hypothetical protein